MKERRLTTFASAVDDLVDEEGHGAALSWGCFEREGDIVRVVSEGGDGGEEAGEVVLLVGERMLRHKPRPEGDVTSASSIPRSEVATILEVFHLGGHCLGDKGLDIFDVHLETDLEDMVNDSVQILGIGVEDGGIHHMKGGWVFDGIGDEECRLGLLTKLLGQLWWRYACRVGGACLRCNATKTLYCSEITLRVTGRGTRAGVCR